MSDHKIVVQQRLYPTVQTVKAAQKFLEIVEETAMTLI